MKTVHANLGYIVLGILLDISLDAIMATDCAWHFISCYFGYRYCLAFHWMLFWYIVIACHFIGCYFGYRY